MTIDEALSALLSGDVSALARLVDRDPSLVRARVASDAGHYCGYFHGATLLHHVAGNPTIAPLPPGIVDVAPWK